MDKQKILDYASRVGYTSTGVMVTHNERLITGSTVTEVVAKMLVSDAEQDVQDILGVELNAGYHKHYSTNN